MHNLLILDQTFSPEIITIEVGKIQNGLGNNLRKYFVEGIVFEV